MSEFMMIFRDTPKTDVQPSPDQIQANVQTWMDWIGGIAAQGKYKGGQRLGFTGQTLHPGGVITDGPYAEVKELVGGYIIVEAATFEEAVEMAKACPALEEGGNVEVRDVMIVKQPS